MVTTPSLLRALTPLSRPLALCLISAAPLLGCPDAEGEYNSFVERRAPFVSAPMAGVTGGEAGVTTGGEAGAEGMIPRIESGRFLLGLAPILDLTKPMTFIADVEFAISEDGQSGELISMRLDPRVCLGNDPTMASAGEGIVYEPSPATPINAQGKFTAELGEQNVPGAANCISGSFINAVITLKGEVLSEDVFCGAVTGNLILPFEYTLNGSTFGAVRLAEGQDISQTPAPRSCADLVSPEMGGAEAGTTAGAEAGTTAGAEAGMTAGAEAGTTAGAEAGTTAGAEAGMTAGAEAGTTAGAEAGTTAGAEAGMTAGAEGGMTGGAQ